jgi:hypothetical protein
MYDDDVVLFEGPVSLGYAHISQAIDLYLIAEGNAPILGWDKDRYPPDWIVRKNMSLSCIIHSFCAVESAVNTIAYNIFRNQNHPHYLAPDDRSFLLKKCVSNWKSLQCIDKYCVLLECAKKKEIPQELLADLRELNNLRNWIVHGFVYKSTILLEKNAEGNYDEIDVENEIDWLKHFPRNRFHPLDRIDSLDARKALLIALRALAWVQPADPSGLLIVGKHTKPARIAIITNTDFDFAGMLDSYIEECKAPHIDD